MVTQETVSSKPQSTPTFILPFSRRHINATIHLDAAGVTAVVIWVLDESKTISEQRSFGFIEGWLYHQAQLLGGWCGDEDTEGDQAIYHQVTLFLNTVGEALKGKAATTAWSNKAVTEASRNTAGLQW